MAEFVVTAAEERRIERLGEKVYRVLRPRDVPPGAERSLRDLCCAMVLAFERHAARSRLSQR